MAIEKLHLNIVQLTCSSHGARQEASLEDGRIKKDLWGNDVHTDSNRCIDLLNKYYTQVRCSAYCRLI